MPTSVVVDWSFITCSHGSNKSKCTLVSHWTCFRLPSGHSSIRFSLASFGHSVEPAGSSSLVHHKFQQTRFILLLLAAFIRATQSALLLPLLYARTLLKHFYACLFLQMHAQLVSPFSLVKPSFEACIFPHKLFPIPPQPSGTTRNTPPASQTHLEERGQAISLKRMDEAQVEDGSATPTDVDKQALKGRLKEMFARIIIDIDRQVITVSESQSKLDSQLDRLISTLDNIKIDESLTNEIETITKKVSSLKSRLTLIHTILNNSSSRCSRTLAACGAAVISLNPPANQSVSVDEQSQLE